MAPTMPHRSLMCKVLGNITFGNVSSRPVAIANFEPPIWRGFGICNDGFAGALISFELHVSCICPRLVRHGGASAPKVRIGRGQRSLRKHRCRTGGGHMGCFGASLWRRRRRETLRRRRDGVSDGPSPVRGGHATGKRVRRVKGAYEHYVKTTNRSHNICNGPLTPVTCTHMCNSCYLALVTDKRGRSTPGLASATPVTNMDFW
jgi:hypothetical protein